MDRAFAAGIVVTPLGLLGYAVGTVGSYPGRALSVTAVMVGVTLLAVGRTDEGAAG